MTPNPDDASMSRRDFFRVGAAGVAATAGIAAGTGTAAAAYDGWLDDVDNYDGTHDRRGRDEVTVTVGAGENGLRFGPAAVLIDPGTTVVWEWSGAGGDHNVVDTDEAFESELVGEEGATFEYTFEDAGDGDTFTYYCDPHQAAGMKGAVAVGTVDDDIVSQTDDDEGGGSDEGDGSDGGGPYGGWLDDVDNYDGTHDRSGRDEVSVTVGAGENGLRFDPAAVLVDQGTTVVWEWSGAGGGHNVVDTDETFESELVSEEGATFEYTFEDAGDGDTFTYFCQPHRGAGMKGAVAVGSVDDDLVGGGADGGSLSGSDIGALALAFGAAGALLVPLFYAANEMADENE